MSVAGLGHKQTLGYPGVTLTYLDSTLHSLTNQSTAHFEIEPRIRREGDRLRLQGRIHIHLSQIAALQKLPVPGDFQGLLQKQFQLLRSQAGTPAGQRRRVNRWFVLHRSETAEPLPVRVLHSPRQQLLITQVEVGFQGKKTDQHAGVGHGVAIGVAE